MTSVLRPPAASLPVAPRQAPPPARERRQRARSSASRLFAPGWPLAFTVAGFPLWWAIGATQLVLPVAALVLLWQLRRSGRLVTPPGFWIWGLFLVLVVISGLMLNVTAPGTLRPSGSGRFLAYGFRLLDYLAVAVFLLYVINTPERVLPRLRIVRWMAWLAAWCVALGLVSIAFPTAGFPTLLNVVLPTSISSGLGESVGRVTLAQLQPVLGVYSPRPAAPFQFTNAWGCTLALLLVWTVVAGWAGSRRTRVLVTLLVAVSIVPIVYSLNRGMWIGLGIALLYTAVRLAARGRVVALAVLALVLGLGTMAFVASPLETIVAERLQNGHSNDIRASLASQAVKAAGESPLVGFGSTRSVLGSDASIAVGKSASCPKCGNADIGSTGQYFLLLVAQGFVGTGVYVAYFLRTLWAYRRDSSVVGIAGTLVIIMSLFFGIAYSALLMPLVIVFLSIGLLWRNDAIRSQAATAAERRRPAPVPVVGA